MYLLVDWASLTFVLQLSAELSTPLMLQKVRNRQIETKIEVGPDILGTEISKLNKITPVTRLHHKTLNRLLLFIDHWSIQVLVAS